MQTARLFGLWMTLALIAGIACAQPFTYQGMLKQNGQPVNATLSMTFKLYDAPTGGNQIGASITQNVPVQNGLFTVQLDFGAVWTGQDRYLEITVGSNTLSPRIKITPAPYAAYAQRPWVSIGNNIFYTSGNVGIGTNNPSVRLSLGSDNANTKLAVWDGGASGVMGFGVGPSQFRIHLPNASNRFSFLDAPNGAEIMTILGNGNVGIGTSNPVGKLHVAGTQEAVAWLQGASTTGTWMRLVNTTSGGRIWSLISTGSANSEGAGRLLFHEAETGVRMLIDPTGVFTIGRTNGGAGLSSIGIDTQTLAIYAEAPRLGMRILATDAIVGTTSAIEAYSYAANTSTIYAYSGSSAGNPVSVYAHNSAPTGAAIFTVGNLVVGGAKAFRIDHPLHPATHYLNHFCTEGPDPYNAYSGIVTLDRNGEAWVQLPDYFEVANRDPRYTLTPVGAPMPNLHVAVEVQNNRFKIAGGAPGKKVSWRIEAIRNDPLILWSGYQTEQEKPAHQQGKYLRPEAYGLPPEMGITPLPPQPLPTRKDSDSDTRQ
jgi:hypothetical protein